MINAALAKYRGKKSNVMHLVIDDAKDDPGFAELPLTESLLEEKELLLLIQGLTPVYRMVFNLYVFEGFKHKEIAEQLGITEGTSKSNLADARAILRKKINQQQKTSLG